MKRTLALAALSLVASGALGCATPPLRSTNTSPLVSTDVRQGTRYALPLRLLVIQIWSGELGTTKQPTNPYAVLAGTTVVPDPRHQYVLAYQGSALSSDELSWEVKNGFLAKVKAKTKDETLSSLDSAVTLFMEVAKAGVRLGTRTPGRKVAEKSLLAQYIVDPLSSRGQQQLEQIKIDHGVEITVNGVNQCDVNPELPACGPGSQACVPGIAYRAEYPYTLAMKPMALSEKFGRAVSHEYLSYGEQVVMLPNRSPVTLMPLSRAAFVEQNMELTLTEGVLTKVTVKKPSQLKSFFDDLVEPLKTIASIPGELFKVRIEQNTSTVNWMKSEAKLLAEMRAFLEAQRAHQAWASDPADDDGGGGGGNPGLGN